MSKDAQRKSRQAGEKDGKGREPGRTPQGKVVIIRNELTLDEQRESFDELRRLEDTLG